jgi:hypothetical protein
MRRIALAVIASGALVFGAAGSASAASNAQGCPGNGNSAQGNAGTRAELVAAAKAAAEAMGSNFGAVQSGYNHTVCGDGQP